MCSRMNHTVSATEVHELAGGILARCLELVDRGPRCTVRNLLLVLFFAAARAGSIFDACRPRRGRHKPRPLVFAFWGFGPSSPAWAREEYRKRYGIETSYRQMNQGRIRTWARDPRLRLLLVEIALILRNVWVWLHRVVLGRVRGRGIELHLELLRLRTMLLMLQRCAEERLGCTETAQEPIGPTLRAPSHL